MKIRELELKGVFEITLEPRVDHRGFFMRAYDDKIFKEHGLDRKWVQENHSYSRVAGTIRGLHFQFPPDTETKLVRVVSGNVFDAFVDLRRDSPTFGQWSSLELRADNYKMLYLPRGFAHGMCSLSDEFVMLYKVDHYYAPENEYSIKWDDPDLGIEWPIKNPVISERDARARSFREFVETYGGLDV